MHKYLFQPISDFRSDIDLIPNVHSAGTTVNPCSRTIPYNISKTAKEDHLPISKQDVERLSHQDGVGSLELKLNGGRAQSQSFPIKPERSARVAHRDVILVWGEAVAVGECALLPVMVAKVEYQLGSSW